jgi:C1A family cysteine protease
MFAFLLFSSFLSAFSRPLDLFDLWLSRFNIHVRDPLHRDELFFKWSNNNDYINHINSQNLSYSLAHNQFSAMDSFDFSLFLNAFNKPFILSSSVFDAHFIDITDSIDWVQLGAVTPVKDQGQCGSCWSFSSTGALEGVFFNKFGKLVSFSEQQLVDCDNFKNGGRDHGCNGGLMDYAFNWIYKNGGLCSEYDYPYVSGQTQSSGSCLKTCPLVDGSQIISFTDVAPSDDLAFVSALSLNPVSVAIQANQPDFQFYKSGVFTGNCGTNLDHGVLAVGFGSLNSLPYYKVKNSWSSDWGDNGYILLARGDQFNDGDGQCGILLQSSFPSL